MREPQLVAADGTHMVRVIDGMTGHEISIARVDYDAHLDRYTLREGVDAVRYGVPRPPCTDPWPRYDDRDVVPARVETKQRTVRFWSGDSHTETVETIHEPDVPADTPEGPALINYTRHEPDARMDGMLWLDPDTGRLRRWNGHEWRLIHEGSDTPGGWQNYERPTRPQPEPAMWEPYRPPLRLDAGRITAGAITADKITVGGISHQPPPAANHHHTATPRKDTTVTSKPSDKRRTEQQKDDDSFTRNLPLAMLGLPTTDPVANAVGMAMHNNTTNTW